MRKWIMFFLFGCLLLVTPTSVGAAKVESKYAVMESEDWEKYDYDTNRFATSEEYLAELDYYVEVIGKHLGVTFEGTKITVGFMRAGGAGTDLEKREILVSKPYFLLDVSYLAHEVTHVLMGGNDPTLREGIASYMQELYGRDIDPINFNLPIHSLAKYEISQCEPELVYGIIGGADRPADSYDDLLRYYIFSHSLVKYLIETYGLEKFLLLYRGQGKNYQEIYGKTRGLLGLEWKDYVLGQASINEQKYLKMKKELREKQYALY